MNDNGSNDTRPAQALPAEAADALADVYLYLLRRRAARSDLIRRIRPADRPAALRMALAEMARRQAGRASNERIEGGSTNKENQNDD